MPCSTDLTRATRAVALERFYASHHQQLAGVVRHHVAGVPDATVADACAFAWLQLVRRSDVRLDARGLSWLITVAIREAWRHANLARRDVPAGAFIRRAEGELGDPEGPWSDPLDRVIALEDHAERLERFARANPRQRRELLLHAAGYRYHEIAALTGTSYTAVNRHLTRGRRRLHEPRVTRARGANPGLGAPTSG